MSTEALGALIAALAVVVLTITFTGFWFFNRFLLTEKAKAERFREIHSEPDPPK